jgi:PPOX class probable F420-dependent enzyme
MRFDDAGLDRLLDRWPIARLATVAPDGRPHVVPVVFARAGGALWSPVDGKAKAGRTLARVRNVAHEPRVALLIDDYGDDWAQLWWLRIDGRASLVAGDPVAEAALRAKYPQYRDVALYAGEPLLVRVAPERVTTWANVPA